MRLFHGLPSAVRNKKQALRLALCASVSALVLLGFTTTGPQEAIAQKRNTPKSPSEERSDFRPPSVPLVTHSPYFCVWSNANSLTDDWTRHWTGAVQALAGLVRIDDKPYRWAGPEPKAVPALSFTGLEIYPTRSIYHMEGGGIRLNVTFLSPLVPTNLEVMSRPVTYVTWSAEAIDGKNHPVSLYFDCTGEWAVNTPGTGHQRNDKYAQRPADRQNRHGRSESPDQSRATTCALTTATSMWPCRRTRQCRNRASCPLMPAVVI